jgi:DNA-binding CsgD family transcriptional regulator
MFLKEREEYVLRELAGGKTQSAIARELGVSGARIGQIKAKAIRKL